MVSGILKINVLSASSASSSASTTLISNCITSSPVATLTPLSALHISAVSVRRVNVGSPSG